MENESENNNRESKNTGDGGVLTLPSLYLHRDFAIIKGRVSSL